MKFKIIMGDYSKDGHSQSEEYIIETNASRMEQVSDLVLEIKEKHGIDIFSECSEYEDDRPSDKLIEILKYEGFDFDSIDYWEDEEGLRLYEDYGLLTIFIFLLNNFGKGLSFEIIFDDIPFLNGNWHKGEYFGQIGYGLFSL